jgi:hypothetical protein
MYVGAVPVLGVVTLVAVLYRSELPPTPSQQTVPAHRYDVEYPAMNYSEAVLSDPVARLQERLDGGEAQLEFDDTGHGYLVSALRELGVDPTSQVLVFSRTSVQIGFITPETPRAIYFSDDTYVAWPPGAPEIEIASMDPNLGPVFYTLSQDSTEEIRFDRKMNECLRCHDSYSLTGGGVPRFITGSGFTGNRGQQVAHESWILVDDRTPLQRRWGGWYVTGTHGQQTHMGNWVIRDAEELHEVDLARNGNVTELSTLIDTEPYLRAHSDIVALMVIDHQTRLQNIITRVNYDTRTLLANSVRADARYGLPQEVQAEVGAIAESLVEGLLMAGEAELTEEITGTSGFADKFARQGPYDAQGRTLRELDLLRRLFRYPCSYLIYSDAFNALPIATRGYIYRRLSSILTGEDNSVAFAHLSEDDRRAILQILRQTKPEFAALGDP